MARLTECKHESAEHLMRNRAIVDHRDILIWADCEQFRCLDCGAWLPLGPANDAPPEVQDEARLADGLAQLHCGGVVDISTRRFYPVEACNVDEACDAYVDGWNEARAWTVGTDPPGPRTPIEIMVDRACGLETDGAA